MKFERQVIKKNNCKAKKKTKKTYANKANVQESVTARKALQSKAVRVNHSRSTCRFPEQFCTQSATDASSLCFASLSFTWIRRTSMFTLSWRKKRGVRRNEDALHFQSD